MASVQTLLLLTGSLLAAAVATNDGDAQTLHKRIKIPKPNIIIFLVDDVSTTECLAYVVTIESNSTV